MTSEHPTYRQRLEKGLVHYRAGSRKNETYTEYLKKGEAAAKKLALEKHKLKESTIRAWISDWKFIKNNKAPNPLAAPLSAGSSNEAAKAKVAKKPKSPASKTPRKKLVKAESVVSA